LFTDKADQNYLKNLSNNFAQQICFTKVWNFTTQPCLNLTGGGQMVDRKQAIRRKKGRNPERLRPRKLLNSIGFWLQGHATAVTCTLILPLFDVPLTNRNQIISNQSSIDQNSYIGT